MNFQNLEIESRGQAAVIWLNRPAVRNALNEVLIAELTQAVEALQDDANVRVLVLAGRGTAFCAGGDLHWMKRMAHFSAEQNHADAILLSKMFKVVHASHKPVIARVHGPAYAGGMGLAAACDIIVAGPEAEFCLSEVRIGLVPATISPYILQALGTQATRRYMLTAEKLPAREALLIGFVHELAENGSIDEVVHRLARALAAGGPQALAQVKALIAETPAGAPNTELMHRTAACIAEVRSSAEGREGISSYLEKRKPRWATT